MKKKFIVEFNYSSEKDIDDFKYLLEGAVEELLYDCLGVGQIQDFDITRIDDCE